MFFILPPTFSLIPKSFATQSFANSILFSCGKMEDVKMLGDFSFVCVFFVLWKPHSLKRIYLIWKEIYWPKKRVRNRRVISYFEENNKWPQLSPHHELENFKVGNVFLLNTEDVSKVFLRYQCLPRSGDVKGNRWKLAIEHSSFSCAV